MLRKPSLQNADTEGIKHDNTINKRDIELI